MLTTTYRVEDSEGLGPYAGGMLYEMDKAHRDDAHPSPWADTDAHGDPLDIRYEEVCALRSLEEVAQWFDGFGHDLAREGFDVVAYSMPRASVRFGMAQLVYNPREQVEIERFPVLGVVD